MSITIKIITLNYHPLKRPVTQHKFKLPKINMLVSVILRIYF